VRLAGRQGEMDRQAVYRWILFNISRKLPGHEHRLPDDEA
jgi:hypothetical protein